MKTPQSPSSLCHTFTTSHYCGQNCCWQCRYHHQCRPFWHTLSFSPFNLFTIYLSFSTPLGSPNHSVSNNLTLSLVSPHHHPLMGSPPKPAHLFLTTYPSRSLILTLFLNFFTSLMNLTTTSCIFLLL